MNTHIISDDKCLMFQTYMESDTELIGEPALLIEEWKGSNSISISTHEENSVLINYGTLPALIKLFQGILRNKSFHEIKI